MSTTSSLKVTFLLYYTLIMLQISSSTTLHPIVLIPGSGGNQLEARLTPAYKPSGLVCRVYPGPFHKDKEGWYRIWFDSSVVLAPYTKCFAERMRLYYDIDDDDYQNAPGVETRVTHFGSTQSLLYLDPNLKKITAYMEPLIKSLEEIGYINEQNLFGAPYDFRYGLAPKGLPSRVGSKYLDDLKDLIEKTSDRNGGKPVILLSHSLGGLFVLHLLNRNTKSWRQKYIKHFVALSTPWAGTVQEMLTFASGYTLGVPLVKPLLVREEQRSSESNLWLMPSPMVFGRSKPLVITPNGNYTACDVAKFLSDIGFSEGVHPYKMRILPLLEELVGAPQVPITCIIGSGVKTPETLFYDSKGFDAQPSIVWGDGDGTVNMLSLLALESQWKYDKNQTVSIVKLDGISHTGILSEPASIDHIIRVISSFNCPVLGLKHSAV